MEPLAQKDMPMVIRDEGKPWVLVGDGQCVARTSKGKRCGNYLPYPCSDFDVMFVGDRYLEIGSTSWSPARMLRQRCEVHDSPEAVSLCEPEWEEFDRDRHAALLRTPRLQTLFERRGGNDWTMDVLAAAVRNDLAPEEVTALIAKLSA